MKGMIRQELKNLFSATHFTGGGVSDSFFMGSSRSSLRIRT